jgi:hypothetical protein
MRAVFDLPFDPTTLEVQGADYNIVQNNGVFHNFPFVASSSDFANEIPLYPTSSCNPFF